LQEARRAGVTVTEEDVKAVARFTYALGKRKSAVGMWEQIRVEARDVAGVELKPVERSSIDGHVVG
jgi:hypothetical protein